MKCIHIIECHTIEEWNTTVTSVYSTGNNNILEISSHIFEDFLETAAGTWMQHLKFKLIIFLYERKMFKMFHIEKPLFECILFESVVFVSFCFETLPTSDALHHQLFLNILYCLLGSCLHFTFSQFFSLSPSKRNNILFDRIHD